jgi:DNA-binding PadR family transcriptional regulator
MDVKTLCLGVLTEGDKTGYEIKHCFESGFSHFFGAGFGSIYPALAELSRRGLVTCRSVEQEKRPDKKVYRLTAAGRRLLLDELMATPPRHKVRSEFLVLIYFAHLLPPDRVARIIDQMSAGWQSAVAEIEACTAGPDGLALTPGMRFAAGYGRAVLGAALAYIGEHRAELVRAVADLAAPTAPERIALAGD